MSETDNNEIQVYASSGNIFADLGRPDAKEAFARMLQAKQNEEIVKTRKHEKQ